MSIGVYYTFRIVNFIMFCKSGMSDPHSCLHGVRRSEFGVLLAYYYVCDRTDFFNSSEKVGHNFKPAS